MSEIIGYGGKGGGGGSGSKETRDSLRSISYAKVLDLVSEGEIQGLVNGLQSIFFDGTRLQNQDGTFNFRDVTADFRPGTQNQDVIAGFPGVENEITIGHELRSEAPWVRAINNTQLSAVRLRLAVAALSKMDKENGDVNGYKIAYQIDVATDGGGYKPVINQTFDGKTTSRYERSHRIELPPAKTGWVIRITRATPNANSALIADTTLISTLTEVIDVKLRYPMSAIVGIQIDASQFQGIPTRSYDLRGRIIKVPSNYDPISHVYTGVWDGTFKPAWTNNPAWVFYDLVLNDRYGLGHTLDASTIDKWSLYQIGRYCDVKVPDGLGGTEPRFTCNLYLQTAAEAYKVLQDLASLFRGISYWAAGSIITSADIPTDPTYIYTAANVIDGKFTGVGSSQRTRYTVALVSWNDPADFYKARVEYVQDDDGIARYGVQKISMTAFGCTSQGQAQRAGNWALLTSRLETDTLTFSVGLDGLVSSPGQIVRIADPHRMGRRNAGRLRHAVGRTVTLDKAPVIAVGDDFTVILPTGITETRKVMAISGDTVTVQRDWSTLPVAQAIWSVDNIDLIAPSYKILSIIEKGGLTYEITALQHEPGKFEYIDNGTRIEERPHTGLESAPSTPTNLLFTSHPYWVDDSVVATNATLSWTGFSPVYRVLWRKALGTWADIKTRSPSIDFKSVEASEYEFKVSAISSTGLESPPAIFNATVTPTLPPLDDITGLRLESGFTTNSAKIAWDNVKGATSYRAQVVVGKPAIVVRTINVGDTPRFEYTVGDMKVDGGPWRTVEFRIKALGKFGTGSAVASLIATNKQIGALVNIRVDQGIRAGYFNCTPPPEDDFAGIIIWISTDPACPALPENEIYDGADSFVTLTKFTDGEALDKKNEYYIRAAAYDSLGKDDLNVSTAIPLTVAGVLPDVGSILESMLTKELSDKITAIGEFDPNDIVAQIVKEEEARKDAVGAVATTVLTVQTQLNGNIASVQAQAKSIDGLSAQYTVKTDVNGYVAGYGLATTIVEGIPQSDFTILADRFAVVQPGVQKRVPFVVTSKNGVAQIGIDGNLLVNGSVTADSILANAITGDKIKAGSLSANVFESGVGSGNLLYNASLTATYETGGLILPDGYIGGTDFYINPFTFSINGAGDAWRPVGVNVISVNQRGVAPNDNQYVLSPAVSIVQGAYYEMSIYTGAHRCHISIAIGWVDVNGAWAGFTHGGWINAEEAYGGTTLSGYKRLFILGQAPAGAVAGRLITYKNGTLYGGDSWMFLCMPYIGVANGANQTLPSPWSPPGIGTQIHGGAIKTSTITADRLAVSDLSAISANLGRITAGDLYSTTIHGGSGYPTSNYAWPNNGGNGFHLSSSGLLLGNAHNGRYFQATANGDLYAPGMSIINGKLTINELKVINTDQLEDNSVTEIETAVSASGAEVVVNVSAGNVSRNGTTPIVFMMHSANPTRRLTVYKDGKSIFSSESIVSVFYAPPGRYVCRVSHAGEMTGRQTSLVAIKVKR
ncbi:host specificity protein J [Solimicrobium silvestre]|uniref:Putative phage tail protein n=1 Tax=Solimicrobium silvestre TaxID=2099400 RepID=A0A2S9GZE6_9BURK|nr:phage tail protein [Solimicrobium silvestre]PRC93101.1 putative phage tail protein [Solimicrobium silvestre]